MKGTTMPKKEVSLPKVYYCQHTESGSFMRVWREGWASDAFDIHNRGSFEFFRAMTSDVLKWIDADNE